MNSLYNLILFFFTSFNVKTIPTNWPKNELSGDVCLFSMNIEGMGQEYTIIYAEVNHNIVIHYLGDLVVSLLNGLISLFFFFLLGFARSSFIILTKSRTWN